MQMYEKTLQGEKFSGRGLFYFHYFIEKKHHE